MHQFAFEGADKPESGTENNVVVHTAVGQITLRKPLVYQEIDGVRKEVSADYVLNQKSIETLGIKQPATNSRELLAEIGNPKSKIQNPKLFVVGFQLAAFDAAKPLVIDPVLSYSTYIGGTGNEVGYLSGQLGIAVDTLGNAYIAGGTSSDGTFNGNIKFPVKGAEQSNFGGLPFDAYVVKLSPTGALIYSTFLGGDSFDTGRDTITISAF